MNNGTSPEIAVCERTFGEYIDMVKAFHGHVAPGMVFGGMCETRACLPDGAG